MVKVLRYSDTGNEDRYNDKLYGILIEHTQGKTITELTKLSNIPRSAVRIQLAKLEGANKVILRKIGMAKVYIINQELPQQHTTLGAANLTDAIKFKGDLNN